MLGHSSIFTYEGASSKAVQGLTFSRKGQRLFNASHKLENRVNVRIPGISHLHGTVENSNNKAVS